MKRFYLILFNILSLSLYSQNNINHQFSFKNSLKENNSEKYLIPYVNNSNANFQQDYLKIGGQLQTIYSINNYLDGLQYQIDNGQDFKNYTYNLIYYMPPSSSYNRIQMFGGQEIGLYRLGTTYIFYGSAISDRPSALPAQGNNYTHIGITKNGTTNELKVYINGEFYKSYINSTSAYTVQSDKKFVFFKDNGGEDNTVKVAYINVANYVQDAETIKQIYLSNINGIKSETYYFNRNILSVENSQSLSISSENYISKFDTNCEIKRNSIVLNENGTLNHTADFNFPNQYSYIFKYLSTDQNQPFDILDFSSDNIDRSIKVINRKVYFGGQESPVNLESIQNNTYVNLAITRDDTTKKINIYYNNNLIGEYIDSENRFTIQENTPVKLLTPKSPNLVHYLSYLKYNNQALDKSKIELEFEDICSKNIVNTYSFNSNLTNSSSTNSLKVSSINNEHSSNTFSTIIQNECNTSNTIYNISPNTRLFYKDELGMYYYNYSISMHYNLNNTQKIKLFGLDDSENGIYQEGNTIILKTKNNEEIFTNNSISNESFQLLLVTRNGQDKSIKFYIGKELIGTFIDINDDFEIKDQGEVIFFNNNITTTNRILLNDISVQNRILNIDYINRLTFNLCPIKYKDSYIFDGNFKNVEGENELNVHPAIISENFYTDKNGNCGNLKLYYKINESESIKYNSPNVYGYDNYTIHLNFRLADYSKLNRIITFDGDKNISLENSILKFSDTTTEFNLSSFLTQTYNLLTIVKNGEVISFYINSNYVGNISSNNNFDFPIQQQLSFFGNSEAFIGNLDIYNTSSTIQEILAYNKNICFKNIDRIYPLFLNLTDSSGENTLTVTSYTNQHLDNKFIQDRILNCNVSRTIYYVADNAGLIFNDGLGELYEDYTISMYFRLNPYLGGYARLIDFSDGRSDAGIYRLSNGLNFYPNGDVGSGLLSNSHAEYTLLTLTRNSKTNIITVYINGAKASTYNDSQQLYKVPANGNIIFLKDDIVVRDEQSPTNLAMIRVSNSILSDDEIAKGYTNLCTDIACIQPGNKIGEKKLSNIGISTQKLKYENWPTNVNGGNFVLESKEKGFILPRISNFNSNINIDESVEGMIVYDNDNKCLKLFNGSEWKCITASCVQ